MSQAKAWMAALALGASASAFAGSMTAAGPDAAKALEAQQPKAMAQYRGRFAAFSADREKALRSAGSRVDDAFVSHWFGPATLGSSKTPMIEFRDQEGLHSIAYRRDGSGWALESSLVSAQQMETVPMGAQDGPGAHRHVERKAQTTMVRPPSAK